MTGEARHAATIEAGGSREAPGRRLPLPACVVCGGQGDCCGADQCHAACPECNGTGRFNPHGVNAWLLAGWGFCDTPKCTCNINDAEACIEWQDVGNIYGRCGYCGNLEHEHGR